MSNTEIAAPPLAVEHADLIQWLNAASNHLSNAVYFLEHPELRDTTDESEESAYLRAWAGCSIVDSKLREQIRALKHGPSA